MQPGPIAIAIVVTAALLLAEHIGMYEQPWHLDPPWSYVIGVMTLAGGWVVWGLLAESPVTPIDAAISVVLISFGSGAVVVLCYAVRARLDRAKKQTSVITKARTLTQGIIDGDLSHAAGQPDLHDPRRNN